MYPSKIHGAVPDDVEMVDAASPTLSPTLTSGGMPSEVFTAASLEQKAPRDSSSIIRKYDDRLTAAAFDRVQPSALVHLATVTAAEPLIPDVQGQFWLTRDDDHGESGLRASGRDLDGPDPLSDGYSSTRQIVILADEESGGREAFRGSAGEQRAIVVIPGTARGQAINAPEICEISFPFPHCSLRAFSASASHTLPRNPILSAILGNLPPSAGTGTPTASIAGDSQTVNHHAQEQPPFARGEQQNSESFDVDDKPVNTGTKGSLALRVTRPIVPFVSATSVSAGSSLKLPPLALALSLSQPIPLRRPAAVPTALSSPGYAARPSSLSLSSPRHSPYAYPSARTLPSSSEALRSARIRLNSTSMSSTSYASPYPSSPVHPTSRSPALPSTPPRQSSSSSEATPLAPSPSSMSMSKRRRAPEWPSPRSYHSRSQSQSLSYPAHPLATGQPPQSAFSRGLAQTIRTPAALRVPPTPDYSPAFYRSGFVGHPPSSSELAAPTGEGTSAGPTDAEPLARNHSPFTSAPPLSTSRLADPPIPRLGSPTPVTGAAAAAAKRQRVNLMGIPKGWVIEQLNERAEQYWHNPASSDVRILVPIPKSKLAKQPTSPSLTGNTPAMRPESAQSFHSNQPAHAVWPPTTPLVSAGLGEGDRGLLGHVKAGPAIASHRRGSLPGNDDVVALVFPLHQDYLITQSSLFRSLFSPATPAPHLDASHSAPRSIKGARRLPTAPGAPPAILLPLPDPASFSVVVHWLYWGDISALESTLSRGLVDWQGVVKNVHYLGMDDNVKRVLGKWWRKWIKTDEGRMRSAAGGSGHGKGGWADSEDEGDEANEVEEVDDEAESMSRGRDGMEVTDEPGWEIRLPDSGKEPDDGGVSGLLRAL